MSDLTTNVLTRGNNLVFVAPPSPSAARAVLAGVLGAERPGKWLALVGPEAIEEWARVGAQLAGRGNPRVAGAKTPARLSRLMRSETVTLVVTSPAAALEGAKRAAVKIGELAGVVVGHEARGPRHEELADLLQDLPKEAGRVIVTSDAAGSAELIERYAWRAHVTDLLSPEPLDQPPPVQSVTVGWGRRTAALLDLVEQFDPETVFVWVADAADAPAIERALAGSGAQVTIGSEPQTAALVVAYDLPSFTMLRALAAEGPVVLLAPPGTEGYVARLAPKRRPLQLTGGLEAAQATLARARREVADLVERSPAPSSYVAIAPLLERHDAAAVAAALWELWDAARAREAPAPVARPATSAVKLWISAGKRDLVKPADLVAALINEAKVPKEAIGKVEIRESFSLVEVGGSGEEAAERLTGKLIRKRRVVAKVDQGREAGGGRREGGGAGPRDPRRAPRP